nr:MAG TPA: DNA N-6-adenine-methyltransferase [Caudoviricetes sp.]
MECKVPLIFLNYIGENMEQAIFSSEKMDWETPQKLFEALNQEFDFTIDLAASPSNAKCSRFYTAKENALEKTGKEKRHF